MRSARDARYAPDAVVLHVRSVVETRARFWETSDGHCAKWSSNTNLSVRLWSQRVASSEVRVRDCCSPAGAEHEDASAAEELPSLAIASGPGAGQVTLRHHGIAAATLAAYEMDVELLFSAQPFGQVCRCFGAEHGCVE